MAIFYRTKLVECETYEDFKRNIEQSCFSSYHLETEGFYDVNKYSKVFKDFDPNVYYYDCGENRNAILLQVCFHNLVYFTSPIFDIKNKTVTFFESEEKREKEIRSNPTKMGKFFRKIAPYFNDKQIEFLVNYIVDYFTDSDYTHHVAKGNEITEVYISKAESGRNVGEYSCLNASCMRYDNWDIHPTKVYATESWELHYLTNEEGEIAARVLVCKEDNSYSYIYASCEHAGDTLREKLHDLEFTDCEDSYHAFDGAKLLKIEVNGGIVAPYIDYHSYVKDCGDHLEISYSHSDYDFCSTSGILEIRHSCGSCGYEYHEEDMISVDGELYCEDCVAYCDHFNEHFIGETIAVYSGHYNCQYVCEDALEDMGAIYNEEMGEWQTEDWYAECTEEEEEDSDDENEPKKEIAPGVKCIVISCHTTPHYFPIGTVVKVLMEVREGVWDCKDTSGFYQIVAAKDLVVVE